MGPRIAIRVDGSHQIGMGHVYRMVNLESALRQSGIEDITFYSRADTRVAKWLEQRDIHLDLLSLDDKRPLSTWLKSSGVDLLINDLLDTTVDYMTEARSLNCRIVNFDDNGPGCLLSDCRINALPSKVQVEEGKSFSYLYQGPDYLLLGEEFSPVAPIRAISKEPKDILVTLGGSDTYGNTLSVITALQRMGQLQRIDVVVGPAFLDRDRLVDKLDGDKRFIIHSTVPSMADMFRRYELAIVGGGITLFEAAVCALPTLSVASESFERINIEWAEAKGVTRFAGYGQPEIGRAHV